jgi:hypothetical protein
MLLSMLRAQRCLLILDNLESILQTGERAGTYRPGYADYGQLMARAGQGQHASCLLLTSRERVLELERLEGADAPVHALHLAGLDAEAGRSILRERGLGEQAGHAVLVERYSGNTLALKLVAATIRDLFAGDVAQERRDIAGDLRRYPRRAGPAVRAPVCAGTRAAGLAGDRARAHHDSSPPGEPRPS